MAEARKRGIDVKYVIISALSKAMGADPAEEAKAHLELAMRYLEEAEKLEDPVQASEKAYKAFEEAVKAAAIYLGLEEARLAEREGRWRAATFFSAIRKLEKKFGIEFRLAAREAWFLHVEGFHEGRLSLEEVKESLTYVRRGINLVAAAVR
ncbi:PaREP1 family protein [Pyrobaculum sp.]|uniref:PaREP1 family protein n=1 Tax=Pyrobaculum sp. TaxID=2004705 RepID=UPI003169E0B2